MTFLTQEGKSKISERLVVTHQIFCCGSFILIILASFFSSACNREPYSADIVSEHIDTKEQLFSVVNQLEESIPFSISALEKIFGCKFKKLHRCNYDTDDNISPWGCSIAADGLNSDLIETVSAFVIPNKTSNDGSVLMYLRSDVPITIDQVKQHFGMYSEIATHPRPYMADDGSPRYFVYRKKWGLLIFDCPNGQNTVKQICLRVE
jgi:hypothetical protein